MRLKPASTNASSSANDAGSFTVQPNTLPPNAIGAVSRAERPSLRRIIGGSRLVGLWTFENGASRQRFNHGVDRSMLGSRERTSASMTALSHREMVLDPDDSERLANLCGP